LTFAELLIALAVLALVICGSTLFLQSSLMYYRRQISAVRGALLGQDLLNRLPVVAARGEVENFTYSLDLEPTQQPVGAWLHLTLSQGRILILKQSRWRPLQKRWVCFQPFGSEEWKQIEVDGPGELTMTGPVEMASSDGHALFWKGKTVYQSDSWLSQPQVNPAGTKVAFLAMAGGEVEVWVWELASGRATCWQRGLQGSDPPCWLTQDSLLVCQAGRQLLSLSPKGQQVLYEGPGLSAPAVSADGSQIAFISSANETNDIFVLDRPARKVKNITQSEDGEIRPLWSPQGDRILFGVAPVAGGSQLGCINADGSGRQDLHAVASGNHWHWAASDH